jgi:hypothetical protein
MSEKRQTHYLSDNVCHSLEEAPYDDMDESDNPYDDDEVYI